MGLLAQRICWQLSGRLHHVQHSLDKAKCIWL